MTFYCVVQYNSLCISLEHGLHCFDLVLVEFTLGVAPEDRHGSGYLSVNVARVSSDQHHGLQVRQNISVNNKRG